MERSRENCTFYISKRSVCQCPNAEVEIVLVMVFPPDRRSFQAERTSSGRSRVVQRGLRPFSSSLSSAVLPRQSGLAVGWRAPGHEEESRVKRAFVSWKEWRMATLESPFFPLIPLVRHNARSIPSPRLRSELDFMRSLNLNCNACRNEYTKND